jgi:hypothetical protein
MHSYERYQKGLAPVGAIVVRLYHSDGEIRGFIRQVEADETEEILPSEELEAQTALRLAENKQVNDPDAPIYIELREGVRWDPAWGVLH